MPRSGSARRQAHVRGQPCRGLCPYTGTRSSYHRMTRVLEGTVPRGPKLPLSSVIGLAFFASESLSSSPSGHARLPPFGSRVSTRSQLPAEAERPFRRWPVGRTQLASVPVFGGCRASGPHRPGTACGLRPRLGLVDGVEQRADDDAPDACNWPARWARSTEMNTSICPVRMSWALKLLPDTRPS